MRILLALHGYPPELVGGTENGVQALARGLARAGHEVHVVSGTLACRECIELSREVDVDPESGATIRVVRVHRDDLYFDHWHKAAHPGVGAAFDALLAEIEPDVVHVHHWIRLTRDLVARAARAGVPAVVTLHDLWTTCLITFRVRAGEEEFCEAPLAASPCLACAGSHPPRTPWVGAIEGRMRLEQHRADLLAELRLARAVLAPSAAHGREIESMLGLDPGALDVRPVPPGRDLDLPRRPPAPRQAGTLRLGTWGQLVPLKGVDLVLAALRRLPDPRAVELVVAGGEPDAGYARRVREAAAGLRVRFEGAYGADELAEHAVSRVDAHVAGTRARESWGLVLDEALTLGLPCILPRAGAFPERVEGGAWASFYEPGDADDLARAIGELVREPERLDRMAAALPARDAVAHTLERALRRTLAAYEDARSAGAPEIEAATWWADGLRERELRAWDASLSAAPAGALGFEEGDA